MKTFYGLDDAQRDLVLREVAIRYDELFRDASAEERDSIKPHAFYLEPDGWSESRKAKWKQLFGDSNDYDYDGDGISVFRTERSIEFVSEAPKIWKQFSRSKLHDGDEHAGQKRLVREEVAEMGYGNGRNVRTTLQHFSDGSTAFKPQ